MAENQPHTPSPFKRSCTHVIHAYTHTLCMCKFMCVRRGHVHDVAEHSMNFCCKRVVVVVVAVKTRGSVSSVGLRDGEAQKRWLSVFDCVFYINVAHVQDRDMRAVVNTHNKRLLEFLRDVSGKM